MYLPPFESLLPRNVYIGASLTHPCELLPWCLESIATWVASIDLQHKTCGVGSTGFPNTTSLSVPNSRIPSTYPKLFGSDRIFNFETTPQSNACGTPRYLPRGRLARLSTLRYSTADRPPTTTNGPGLAWMALASGRTTIFASSTHHCGAYFRDSGFTAGLFSYCSSFTSKFISACASMGIAPRADFNTPSGTLGAGQRIPLLVSRDVCRCERPPGLRRVSTESAYLTLKVLNRRNLLAFEDYRTGVGRVTAVEVSPDKGFTRLRIIARREVVLCAGAIHTPQVTASYSPNILLLSGVGPAAQLEAHGIPLMVDLPGVGAHLMDHPVVDVVLEETSGASLNYLEGRSPKEMLKLFAAMARWVEAAAFFRSTDSILFPPTVYPQTIEDLTSGSDAPDVELLLSNMAYLGQAKAKLSNIPTLGLHVVLLRPQSVGSVTLRSADPFQAPNIVPNYLSSDNDLQVLLRGLDMLLRVAHTPPLSNILVHTNRTPLFGHYLLFHPTSTARMALRAAGGVVDAWLRVHGVDNLRIADASVFPTIPANHTAAPTLAVAETAADMIKTDKNRQIS
ncbi:alcohol oxidase [Mycena latifolia]|nr:alcohol oxidase [Mycena latifolia]